jgi:P2 family phage major capsid protein
MRNETRELFNTYVENIANLNGIPDATKLFTVDPSIAQKIETKQQESVEFLGRINIYPVDELIGETIGVTISGPIASRTDTTTDDRQTRDPSGLVAQRYKCEETDFNTHLTYQKVDAWAKFDDFETRIRDAINTRQGLDRIMIGWNGTHVAPDSDLAAFPKLQDMNIGWLQEIRLKAPSRVMGSETTAGASDAVAGVTVAEPIIVGPGQEYRNLDALVFDAVNLLDPWHQESTDLVVICGRKLLGDKYFPILNRTDDPTEMLAGKVIVSQKTIGNLPAVRVPYFPDNALLITSLENLSIYVQEGSRRRKIEDNAKRKRIEDYQSSNEDYVVEDFGMVALVENISTVTIAAEDAGEV